MILNKLQYCIKKKFLVDTNVVINVLTSREPWNKSAEKIFLLGANHVVDMYITASSATDIYYIIRKHLHDFQAAKQIASKKKKQRKKVIQV